MAKVITEQGIFDHVYRFIKKQGQPCMDDSGACLFRLNTPDGRVLACAAGALISDKEARNLPPSDWSTLCFEGLAPKRFDPFKSLIAALQYAHDDAARCASRALSSGKMKTDNKKFLCYFKRYMIRAGNRYNLTVPD